MTIPPSKEQVEAAKDYLDDRQEQYQREAVNQVLNGDPVDAAKWEEEADAIRTILSALASAERERDEAVAAEREACLTIAQHVVTWAIEKHGIGTHSDVAARVVVGIGARVES